jgi:hypothetical protein
MSNVDPTMTRRGGMITPHTITSKMWFSCWAAAAFQLRQAPVVVPDFAIGEGAIPAHFLNMAA